jgi:hypothetical protein
MSRVRNLLADLSNTFRRPSLEAEIDDELRFHIDMRIAENRAAGMTPDEAKADALRRFGDLAKIRAKCLAVDRQNLTSGKHLLLRVVIVFGIVLRVSNINEGINVFGQMVVILGVLCSLLDVARSRLPTRFHSDLLGQVVPSQPSFPVKRLQLFLAVTLVLLSLLTGGMAVAAFSTRVGQSVAPPVSDTTGK